MRVRFDKNAEQLLQSSDIYIDEAKNVKGKWNELFGNDNEIHLEIGMGKGDYIYNMALKYPNINFIGIEKYSNVLARAVKKYPKSLPNLRICLKRMA